MKKILTIALALILVLAAVPAMAFTDTTASSATAPKLSIYLVDYSDSGFFGLATLPAADRGYAKNEIVAAIVEMAVPKGTDMTGYGQLYFKGTNATLNVTENTPATVKTVGDPTPVFMLSADGYTLTRLPPAAFNLTAVSADTTYKWLFFAKVQGDGASLSVTLTDGLGVGSTFGGGGVGPMLVPMGISAIPMTLGGVTYVIVKHMDASPYGYDINVAAPPASSTYQGSHIELVTDSTGKTIGMRIAPFVNGTPSPLLLMGVSTTGVLGYFDPANPSVLITSASQTAPAGTNWYTQVMAVYNDVVKGVFGLDYFKIGNYLSDSFFTGFTSNKTITATVDIKPWAAYVTVPQTLVVDPPKTGDAAGIMGFVMIALAAAATVVVRKVRA